MQFEFATAGRIIFGAGTIKNVVGIASGQGKRLLLVTGKRQERAQELQDDLAQEGIECMMFSIPTEPTIPLVEEGVLQARKGQCDMVIAIGGGSVIDGAKVIAAMLKNTGDLMDYLEVIGGGRPLNRRAAPCIAVPTTAGTGAEVTQNSVLASPKHRVKVSVRSPFLLPVAAVVDPELTTSTPPELTAASGLDALTQLIEAFVSNKANPLTDGICREGLMRAGRSLRTAYLDGSNYAAREDMAIASLFGGLALANAKLGAVHGFAGPLGGTYQAPHGLICGKLLPLVMEANIQALRRQPSGQATLQRFDIIARELTADMSAQTDDGLKFVRNLCQTLKLPKLVKFGLIEDDITAIVTMARKAGSMKGNPVTLSNEALVGIMKKCL